MPKMGRIKTGLTGRNVPKLNLNEIESDYTESEYSGLKNLNKIQNRDFGTKFSP